MDTFKPFQGFFDLVRSGHSRRAAFALRKAFEAKPDGSLRRLRVGSLSVIFGYKARVGALLLIIVVLMANYYVPGDRLEAVQYQIFSIPLLGGLLFVLGNGAGPFGLDGQAAVRTKGGNNWREAAEPSGEPDAQATDEVAKTDADETAGTDA